MTAFQEAAFGRSCRINSPAAPQRRDFGQTFARCDKDNSVTLADYSGFNMSGEYKVGNLTGVEILAIDISIVVPVYRSQETLPLLYRRVVDVLESNSCTFEIVLVEDCGGDDSWNVITRLSDQDIRVKGIRLSRNYGQHNALLCGIREARGNVIVTLDDDLQNPPEEIPKLLIELAKGYDVVYGYPLAQTHGFLRNMASRVTKLALRNAMGAETASKASAFRAFRSHLKESFANYRSPAVNIEVLLTWGTTNFGHVLVRQDERTTGESGYTIKKLAIHAVNMATGFSTLPLQFASVLGIIFSLVGMLILIYVLIRYLTADTVVPGFSFIASMIAIFSGAQLFCIGIIGEYLARMHSRSMERPAYNILQHVTKEGVTIHDQQSYRN